MPHSGIMMRSVNDETVCERQGCAVLYKYFVDGPPYLHTNSLCVLPYADQGSDDAPNLLTPFTITHLFSSAGIDFSNPGPL